LDQLLGIHEKEGGEIEMEPFSLRLSPENYVEYVSWSMHIDCYYIRLRKDIRRYVREKLIQISIDVAGNKD
jgi:hypothetical protein